MSPALLSYGLEQPWWLLLSALPPLLYYLGRRRGHDSRAALRVADASKMPQRKSWRVLVAQILPLLFLLSMLAIIMALARPVEHFTEEKIKAEGIDIVLVQDVSGSMLATDFEPNRLEATKAMAIEFVQQRPYDRIGLVVFGGEAFSQSPLTLDHNLLVQYIDELEFGMIDDGTAIGMGLATAINRIKDVSSDTKVVILLTDGVSKLGYIDPSTAADIAKQQGVKVYTIGVGSEGYAMMPYRQNQDGTYLYRKQAVKIDEVLLKQIADVTGGQYFRAKDMSSLEQVYSVIDQLEKTEIEVSTFARQRELFRYPLGVGLVLLLSFIGLRLTVANTDLYV